MGMIFGGKCPQCWERYENCTCSEGRGSDPVSRCNRCGRFLNRCTCDEERQTMSFMPTMFKCEKCGLSIRHCKCDNLFPQGGVKELGRITPIKAYQTSDGRKFTGSTALEDAQDHQRWLNEHRPVPKEEPRKKPLKKLKRKRRKL